MKTYATINNSRLLSKVQVIETAILLEISLILPVLIHLIPIFGVSSWGARLLPIYYAPLIAALFYRAHVGLIVTLCPPWINHLFTGMPNIPVTSLLTCELLIFVLLIIFFVNLAGRKWFYGPLAYLVAKTLFFMVLLFWPPDFLLNPPLDYFKNTLFVAIPGILLLGLVNWGAIRLSPKKISDG